MKPALLALALAALAAGPAPAHDAETATLLQQEMANRNVFKAWFPSRALARRAAISLHGQLLESRLDDGYQVFELDPVDQARLRAFGFRLEVAEDFIRARNARLQRMQRAAQNAGPGARSIPSYACYETVEESFAQAQALAAAKPQLASWIDAGNSWQKASGSGGYDLGVLKLSNAAVAPPPGQSKPKLFINSAIHAREYATAPLVLEFARQLVNGHGVDADATWVLDHHELHLMLHTNPDGRKRAETGLSWRKNTNNNHCANSNTRGVDLNRNFSHSWNVTNGEGSSGSACSLTYRGPSAGSEPETQAVEAYVRSLWPDRRGPNPGDAAPADTSGIHLDIHSFSQLVLWPWGDSASPAPNGAALATLGRRFAWFNGYTPMQSVGLYPTDGTSDAVSYGELGVPAYTFELGTSFFESCATFTSSIKPGNLPALMYAAKVVRTPYLTPSGPQITELSWLDSGVVAPGGAAKLQATASDLRFNQSEGSEATQAIAGAEAYVDTPPWLPGAVALPLSAGDGRFDAPTEALAGSCPRRGPERGPAPGLPARPRRQRRLGPLQRAVPRRGGRRAAAGHCRAVHGAAVQPQGHRRRPQRPRHLDLAARRRAHGQRPAHRPPVRAGRQLHGGADGAHRQRHADRHARGHGAQQRHGQRDRAQQQPGQRPGADAQPGARQRRDGRSAAMPTGSASTTRRARP
jgi:carboxypeptidase T